MVKKNEQKVIGAGGYGCVIKPAIKCKNDKLLKIIKKNLGEITDEVIKDSKITKKQYKNRVSKIMRTGDALDEYEVVDELVNHNILPKDEIFYCKADPIGLKKNIKKCRNKKFNSLNTYSYNRKKLYPSKKTNLNKKIRLILPKFRGLSTHIVYKNKNFKKLSAKKLYKSFLKAVGFLKKLHSHKDKRGKIVRYVHGDVKDDNILFDIEKSVFTVIDYGFTKSYKDLFDDGLAHGAYYVFPFDYGIINIIYKYHNREKDYIVRRLKRYALHRREEWHPNFLSSLAYKRKCNSRILLAIVNLENNFRETVRKCINIKRGLSTEFGKRFDVLGLGYALYHIMRTMDKDFHSYTKNKKSTLKIRFFYEELQNIINLAINQNMITYPDMKSYIGEQTPTIRNFYDQIEGVLTTLD